MKTQVPAMRQGLFSKGSGWLAALPFLLPALIVYGLYNVFGLVRTVYYSQFDWTGLGPASDSPKVGFDNYVRLFNDGNFWHALQNNLLLVVVSVVFQLGLGLGLAVLITSTIKGTKFFRTVYFMPMLLSTVATGILWALMFDPYSGLFNGILQWISPDQRLSWLGSESVVMFAVLFVICWQYTPQYMILLRAGMTTIPEELYEAATIDGAGKSQQFFKITFPLLSNTLKTSAVLSIVGSLKYFDLIWIMTGGGPNGYSELMATYMYKQAFSRENMGFASAIATCMVIISLAVVAVFQYMTRSAKDQ